MKETSIELAEAGYPQIVVHDAEEPEEQETEIKEPLVNGNGNVPTGSPTGSPWGTPVTSRKANGSNGRLHIPGGSPSKTGAYEPLGFSQAHKWGGSISSIRLSASREDIADMRAEQKIQLRRAPKDRFKFIFFLMSIHGIATLLPWNMFITADSYFTDHKFGNVSDSAEYKDKFVSYIGIAGFIPNVFFLAVSLFVPPKSSRLANMIALNMMLTLFVITTILAIIDSSEWPGAFFGITMATVVLFNGAAAVYQSGIFAFSAKLPGSYLQSYIVGQGLGGTFVAVISIITLATTDSVQTAGIAYFTCAVVVLFIAVISLILVYKSAFVDYHHNVAMQVLTEKEKEAVEEATRPITLLYIFKRIWVDALSVWLTFFVTLAIFPAFNLGVVSTTEEPHSDFIAMYFTPLTCFFTFNFCDFIGSMVPAVLKWPFHKYTWIVANVRILFFPLFILCNYRPATRTLPVYFNDIVYIIIMVIFSLSNGYFKTVIMMEGPQKVPPEWAGKAASMMCFFLVLGIFCGLQFSLFFPWFITIF
ncbi:equilibrative nucleoside transporter 1-like [Patiria miniata]|uniref:Equilibrative nucleoside transporter 1 n=1 Tax=Patiria miniata TaxID=46514 RepID=A0A914BJD0_PATMI|nr:equilibrative nucleoside transporter 1-like [Patiria miniata]XP_038076388.1 equilibrative nucleoside transporter 1-like [Patiria miniata]